jgi:hypothetical protein
MQKAKVFSHSKKYHCTVDMADCDGPELPIKKEEKERQD